MDNQTIRDIAREFYNAEQTLTSIRPITERYPDMTLDESYRVQLAVVAMKRQNGQRVVGKKVGLTNKAVQKARGISEPDYGHIMDRCLCAQEPPLKISELITEPVVEAEIAFVLKKPLQGPHITPQMVLEATDYILPAIEVVERRCFPLSKTIQDTICDNAACGRIILGNKKTYLTDDLDLRTVGLILMKNEELIDLSCSAAVLGSPVASIVWLAEKLAAFGSGLHANDIIMTGSIGLMHAVKPGDSFTAYYGDGLGHVSVHFVD